MSIKDIIWECIANPKIHCLVTCRTWKELKTLFDSYISLADPYKINRMDMTYYFANGSRLYFAVVDTMDDTNKLNSMQFDKMYVDHGDPNIIGTVKRRLRNG